MSADLSRSQVDLAREATFRLGVVEVHPSLSEVEWRGVRETLQPKVMQVLVALAHARGEVVSRDALIEACWDGRAVGDDAIHRCIAQVRRLAERTGAFAVETIPRVGHRLTVAAGAPPLPGRPILIALAAVLVGVLAAGAFWTLRSGGAPASPRVEVTALKVVGGGAGVLAQGLSADIAGVLNESGVQTTLSPLSPVAGGNRADFRLSGTVREEAGRLFIRVFLEDPRAGLTLWSREFQGPVADADRLRQAAAAATTESVYTALEPLQQKGLKLDPETLALHIRGSEVVRDPQLLRLGDPRRAFEQVVARAPGFAAGHGVLAVTLANEARRASGPEQAALWGRTRTEAEAAIRINPFAAGAAYDALYMIRRQQRPRDIVGAEDQLLAGLRHAPEFPFLNMRECRLLTEVGRANDALPYCQRALALRPLAGPIGYSNARAVYVSGDPALADQAIELAILHNPDHASTRLARFEFAALGGSPQRARALLHDPRTTPQFVNAGALPALDTFLRARETRRPADVEAALRDLAAAVAEGRLESSLAVRAAAALGRTDAAFALLAQPQVDRSMDASGVGFLLEPSTAPMRTDPRFWAVAARAGLADYWTRRGRWPDFCGRQVALATCKAEAARALGRAG